MERCRVGVPSLHDGRPLLLMKRLAALRAIAAAALATGLVPADPARADLARADPARDDVVRLPIEGSQFPIAAAVIVPPGARVLHVSGQLPDALAPRVGDAQTPDFGSTEQQTRSVLSKVEAILQRGGMTLGDVVMMRVFLVGDPAAGGRMDFAGMMRAYRERFGTVAQPKLPARTVVQVVALPVPGALVEIDAIAARETKP
jgi:enamine deaminase RidA (YjgF/YER057c/UK114 family)